MRPVQLVGAVGALLISAALGGSVEARASGTAFNVPCGDIALLEQAVATSGATVNLAAGCTYHLPGSYASADGYSDDDLPVISGSITVNGHGATLLNAAKYGGRIFEIGPNGYLTVNSTTIAGGSTRNESGGGGLMIDGGGSAVLNQSVVKNNRTIGDCGSCGGAWGGGIYSVGTLRLNYSKVVANTAPDPDGSIGGGIFSNGILSLSHTTVSGNSSFGGGGIAAGGTVSLTSSQITANKVTTSLDSQAVGNSQPIGGGIDFRGGTMSLSGTTVRGNGISNPNYCPGCSPPYDDSQGGGIYVGGGSVSIAQSQLRNNTAATKDPTSPAQGGGLYNGGGTVTFYGGVVEYNAATNNGGGSAGGGGIFNGAGSVTISGTVVLYNNPDNCEPAITGC